MVVAGRVQRYVFKEALSGLAVVLTVILFTILLIDVVEQFRTVGSRAEIGLGTAVELTLLKAPALIQETLPFAVLFGSILTYSRLSRRSELPAMRAAGISAWRFLGPEILLAFLIGIVMVGVLDPLATRLSGVYEERRAELLDTSGPVGGAREGVWLSQSDARTGEQAFIRATRVSGRAAALENVTFLFFAPASSKGGDREFARRIDGRRAVLRPDFWQIEDAVENAPGRPPESHPTLAIPTTLKAETLLSRYASSKTIEFWDLPAFIRDTRGAGLDVERYVLKFHTLLATPFLMVAMAMIGAVVCLRLARSGGLTKLISGGAAAGFALFSISRIAGGLSASGAAPPEAAAWCPSLFAMFAVLNVIAYAEDG